MNAERARAIRLLALDVDGVLTDGSITYGNDGEELKSFSIKDGLGIKLHADQLSDGGGAALAAGFGAVSAEHLEYVNEDGIRALAQAGTGTLNQPNNKLERLYKLYEFSYCSISTPQPTPQ